MKKSKQTIYAFIDSQNLNLGVRSQGWRLDYSKFRQYLSSKYGVKKAFVFIGFVSGNQWLYTLLQKAGFICVFKPTFEKRDKNGKLTIKGNVDAELVLHTMIEWSNYDQAIIVSGDGDFHCLIEHLSDKKKLLKILVPTNRYSSLLKRFGDYIVRIDLLQSSLETKKAGISGRPKP